MIRFWNSILLLSCFLTFGYSKLNQKPLQIINGEIVSPPHSLPNQVLLILGSDPLYDLHFCGGVLISNEWVLTSGNCTKGADRAFGEAYLGSQNITKEEDELQFSFVASIITHEDFDSDSLGYNIGLVNLATAPVFNDAVKAIDLPFKNQTLSGLVGKSGTISGWGSKNVSNIEEITFVLQSATTTILEDSKCTESNTDLDLITNFCARSDKKAHIYGADFGGPLVVDGKVVGISNVWSGVEGDDDLFTNVHYFLDWISEITGIPVN